jgi:hypothetical protein
MSQQINLLNPSLLRKRFALTPATGTLGAVALALVVTGGVAYREQQRLDELGMRAAELETTLKEMNARYESVAALAEAPKPHRSGDVELAHLNSRLKTRQQVVDILEGAGVGSTTGFSDYLRAFSRQAVSGLWLTGFDIAEGGAELKLTGRTLAADLLPVYLERLNREAPLQGRHFAFMRISEPRGGTDAAATEQKGEASAERPPAPRYLEFEIASAGLGEQGPARRAEPHSNPGEGVPVARLAERLSATQPAIKAGK